MDIVILQVAGGLGQLPLILGMVVVFYFFFIRPQQKKQKETKKFIEEIKKGTQIVTVGGIHGKVVEVSENQVLVDVDRGTKLLIEKSSISLEASKKLDSNKKEKSDKK